MNFEYASYEINIIIAPAEQAFDPEIENRP